MFPSWKFTPLLLKLAFQNRIFLHSAEGIKLLRISAGDHACPQFSAGLCRLQICQGTFARENSVPLNSLLYRTIYYHMMQYNVPLYVKLSSTSTLLISWLMKPYRSEVSSMLHVICSTAVMPGIPILRISTCPVLFQSKGYAMYFSYRSPCLPLSPREISRSTVVEDSLLHFSDTWPEEGRKCQQDESGPLS